MCNCPAVFHVLAVDFDTGHLSKQVNAVQKEIAAKKKVRRCVTRTLCLSTYFYAIVSGSE